MVVNSPSIGPAISWGGGWHWGEVPLDCHDFTSCPYPYCKDDVRNMHEDLYQHGHPVVHLWPFFPANDPHDSWPFMWKIWWNLTPTMAKLKEQVQMFVVKFPSKFLCNKFTVSWILPWNYSSEVFFVHRFSMQQLWIRIAKNVFTFWNLVTPHSSKDHYRLSRAFHKKTIVFSMGL